ncbi:tRNA (guanine-N(7)-)-methyltransferase [Aphanomyces invadans]|uniref:tRNA (guanine-N(7)-)-methyltransferase n=1 Tax=Aphanomyces invadans TaxID=157072 RepID=A0A024TU48_9STRA|nr:tRNA (guanine-N(7)-)-methyltransferase [Aphanomyces invadans]ETV97156.1 tRNA (guanine-N(7)-)-methyltransferase [Aphanomyces invadans]|eukprot:XP_008874402.1 tRNA (guanine-N(7)-)-methyltransferase [Aphanomyces invadans]
MAGHKRTAGGDMASATTESEVPGMPQKKFYRSRAHCNPLSHNDLFEYPLNPTEMDWSAHYPKLDNPKVNFLDIGCGFGGLTIALANLFPNKTTLAMEIRPKVTEYVRLRIEALRQEHASSNQFQNVSVLRTNAMRYLPHYFEKGQIEKMFFCFPDPQFKQRNHRRRIVNTHLLTEYAYFIPEGGILYTITDVEDLHNWHVAKCDSHPCFERITDDAVLKADPCVQAMTEETEEGKKVARSGGNKYVAVYRRVSDAVATAAATSFF